MNTHYCPECKRGYWVLGSLGDMEPIPNHTPQGKVVKKQVDVLCSGSRKKAVVVKPPGAI